MTPIRRILKENGWTEHGLDSNSFFQDLANLHPSTVQHIFLNAGSEFDDTTTIEDYRKGTHQQIYLHVSQNFHAYFVYLDLKKDLYLTNFKPFILNTQSSLVPFSLNLHSPNSGQELMKIFRHINQFYSTKKGE